MTAPLAPTPQSCNPSPMNYRHIYHAGNFADVFKHCLLVAIIESLKIKPTAFCCLDTHAGIGLYPLFSKESQIKQEFSQGISALLQADEKAPPSVQKYLELVKACNPNGHLQYYPGSPVIIRELLRPQDRAVFSELHPEDATMLSRHFKRDPQVNIHHLDAYLALKGLLPPKERRGLVLIDPPFEVPDEFEKMNRGLDEALKRWETGVYALWYPVKNKAAVKRFLVMLEKSGRSFLKVDFALKNADETKLYACGMVILNPPWTLEKELKHAVMPYLAKALDAAWCVTGHP